MVHWNRYITKYQGSPSRIENIFGKYFYKIAGLVIAWVCVLLHTSYYYSQYWGKDYPAVGDSGVFVINEFVISGFHCSLI